MTRRTICTQNDNLKIRFSPHYVLNVRNMHIHMRHMSVLTI